VKTIDRPLKTHQPCPKCDSSDAYTEYVDHGYCFSCSAYIPFSEPEFGHMTVEASYQYMPWRGVTKETMQTYETATKVIGETPTEIGFKYSNGRTKVRLLSEKAFRVTGEKVRDTGALFGVDKFPPGSAQAITITEGELDAMSVYQMMGSKYPVVSVSSAVVAKADCAADQKYLDSFEKIYLCFDNDEPGQKAKAAVASLFDFNKVYDVQLVRKDANEYLQAGEASTFTKLWWNAKRFLPEGVLSTYNEFDKILDEDVNKKSVPYPFETLDAMTYGIRTGEIVLLKAPEKIGKTEVMRAIEYHLLKKTDDNIGIIHLEEGKARNLKGLAGYELNQPVHLPDSNVSKDEIKTALRKLTGRDERVHIYSHFGSDDPDIILNTIRFLASTCNCKYIFLDHITMVVTGLEGEDERKALDYISTRLAMMVRELDFCLFLVSHVNDEGKTRGSRNIAKVADLIISLNRDIMSPDPEVRNLTTLMIEGNRFASQTGPSSRLRFDPSTFKLEEQLELPFTE